MSAPTLDAFFRANPSLESLLRGVERAAQSDATVLVLGEAGSGRSTLARALHGVSGRAGAPLEEVDIAAIPASLFESELFGHEAGAFTDADAEGEGRVARAGAGSLLLDRVEEIPLAVQAKLLRLLEDGRYAPLGGTERRAACRFLAVGSSDLAERVARGAFREDLYFRLEVLTFVLPPLAERREDLEPLLAFLLEDLGERLGRDGLALSDRARGWMEAYRWPGNLREVRNVLERAAILTPSGPLDPSPPSGAESARPLRLAEVEEREIRRALAYTKGHQGKAATLLGISRKALWEKRKRLGIP